MKKAITYVKDRIITGLVVIVPIAVIGVILAGTIKELINLTLPVTENMQFGGPLLRTLVVIILVILLLGIFFFITGALLKTYFGERFKSWLEAKLLSHIPFFKTINNVVHQLSGLEKGHYSAVEVNLYGNESRMLGIHTETLEDGRMVIFLPFSPVVNIGQMIIVPAKQVEKIDISLKDFMDILSAIGFEANKIFLEKGFKGDVPSN